MDPVDLGYAVKLPPRAAYEYLSRKGYKITGHWWELWQDAHAREFTVAHLARTDLLTVIRDSLLRMQREGETRRSWVARLSKAMRKAGWWGKGVYVDPDTQEARIVQLGSVRRLTTIFHVNKTVAAQVGRWTSQQDNRAARPYLAYVGILDIVIRPEHRAMDYRVTRSVFPIGDPALRYIYPPNDWGCRCRMRAMSESELGLKGLSVRAGAISFAEKQIAVDKQTGESITGQAATVRHGGASLTAAPEWSYNPGMAGIDVLTERARSRLNEVSKDWPSDLTSVVRRALDAGPG